MKDITIHIVSGFLGAGKTTFINRLLGVLDGKAAVIENEFGDVSVDTTLIEKDVPVRELRSGCICCSLKGEFSKGIAEAASMYDPDVLVIEPSGVGKLSEVERSVREAISSDCNFVPGMKITLVESPSYMEIKEDYGAFYMDQIRNADLIILNLISSLSEEETEGIIKDIRSEGVTAPILASEVIDMDEEDIHMILRSYGKDEKCEEHDVQPSDHHISGDHQNADAVFQSFTFRDLSFRDEEDLKERLNALRSKFSDKGGRILRIKGFVTTEKGERLLVNMTQVTDEIRPYDHSPEGNDVLVVTGSNLKRKDVEAVLKGQKKRFIFKRRTTDPKCR